MAIMIPDQIPDGAPQSEKIIFKNLMYAPQARNWVVFHSEYVDNPNHPIRPREIDFLIFTDNCSVICLEAKGGSYEINNREWYRLPDRELVQPSPPEQARTAMFALQKEFAPHFGSSSLLSLGCAVAFTDSQFPLDIRKPKQALIIERPDARNPDRLAKKLADYADDLPTKQVREILDTNREKCMEALEALNNLRSELEKTMIIEPPKTIFRSDLETLRPQLLRLTTAQLNSLNRVSINDRCVIDGAAGTGKTVLAMELARQRCEEGDTVALLCSNPYLSYRFDRWTKTLPKNSGGRVVAGTPATLPSWVFRSDNALKNKHQRRLDNSPELETSLKRGYHLDHKWPSFIDETVEDLGAGGIFDYLIVDEAQNLCDEMFLKLMNILLKNGLAEGHWTMFGDFTYQNIVSPHLTQNGKDVLKNFGLNWSNDTLQTNCRNTHEIAVDVAKYVDIIVEIIIICTFLRFHRLTLQHCIPIYVLCSRNLFQ